MTGADAEVDSAQAVLQLRDELIRAGMVKLDREPASTGSTRDRVLEAAVSMFAERGFDACTMRDLAASVGVKAPAIYNHFESKEQILAEASRDATSRFLTAVVGPIPDDPEDERFKGIVERWVRFQVEEREIARANDALLDAGVLRRVLDPDEWGHIADALRILIAIVGEFVSAEGDLKNVDSDLVVRMVIAVCDRAGTAYKPGGELEAGDLAEQSWVVVRRMVGA